MFHDLKPGSHITVTVTKTPRSEAARETIRRILLSSLECRKITKHAQNKRRKSGDWRPRAGRLWNNRPKVARHYLARAGETSTIPFRPQIANDLASVSDFISVEPAAK